MAVRPTPQPGWVVGPDQPKPGSDGAMTWKASAGSPPWAAGSVSGPITFRNSTTEPGQPWLMSSGRASAWGDRWWMAWMRWPSMVVTTWSRPFSRASAARQSKPSAQ